jgi:hypothetical protein
MQTRTDLMRSAPMFRHNYHPFAGAKGELISTMRSNPIRPRRLWDSEAAATRASSFAFSGTPAKGPSKDIVSRR